MNGDTNYDNTQTPRKPWLAGMLSLAAAGLGHLYCGQLAKGLILFFISFAFAPIIVNVAQSSGSTLMLSVVMLSLGVGFGVIIYAAIDSMLLARRSGGDYRLKEYNHWFIYLIFIIVSFGYPTNLSFSIREHVLQAFKIPSASMTPSILQGDRVFLNKLAYRNSAPQRGDVVIFIYPDGRHLFYLKRIVGLPGDTVEIRENQLLVNGVPAQYTIQPTLESSHTGVAPKQQVVVESINGQSHRILTDKQSPDNMLPVTIPHGYCFLLGDNRMESKDSRTFGPVPLVDVKGRVDYIYWPAKSWSRFGRYSD